MTYNVSGGTLNLAQSINSLTLLGTVNLLLICGQAVKAIMCLSRVATHLENLEKSGNSKVVREKSGKLKFASAEELKLQLLAACGPGPIDTLVAFNKLATMLVIINMKLFKNDCSSAICSISIIFTCPG